MSWIREWIGKRPHLKRRDFWLGFLLIFAGIIWSVIFFHNFPLRTLGNLIMLGGIWIVIVARRLK